MKNGLCITTFLVATTLVGCTQNNGPEAKFSTLTQVVGAAAEEDCPNGGIELEHGIDTNGNGTLDDRTKTTTAFAPFVEVFSDSPTSHFQL